VEQTLVPDGRVKVVYRHLVILGQESQWAAEASECAGEQGKFWEYHDLLMANQGAARNNGAFSKANLKQFGTQLGLNADQFGACVDSDKYAGKVQAETAAGRQRGISRTPTVIVNGQRIEGVPTFDQIRLLVGNV
jgi:protein-disulfide isomerase